MIYDKIFGNVVPLKLIKKGEKHKKKFLKKFGNDLDIDYNFKIEKVDSMSNINLENMVLSKNNETNFEKSVVIGTIRMGFGHYRIGIAIASAINFYGYRPIWFDIPSFTNTHAAKVVNHLNNLYSLGSKLSQKYSLFNKLYWEPLNSEGFRKLEYNYLDQCMTSNFVSIYKKFPEDIPFVATHVWPSQAAIHSGLKNVINMIPDNWPMALHLSEGAIHTVQTESSYLGYRVLRGMDKYLLNPIDSKSIYNVGHYVDHEIVSNIENDVNKRFERLDNKKTLRLLFTVGGAGAQFELYNDLIKFLKSKIVENKVALYINVGDHRNVFENFKKSLNDMKNYLTIHTDWNETKKYINNIYNKDESGIHLFYNENIFPAVYTTNLLMRVSDLMFTKPSELSFYPIPKVFIKRIGGHEAWGAIRSSEIGDGTFECDDIYLLKNVVNLIISDSSILKKYNDNIIINNKNNLYNGAYNVCDLLLNKKR